MSVETSRPSSRAERHRIGADEQVFLIPERRRPNGPVVTARLRRTAAGFGIAWLLALVPIVVDASPRWKAFGLGVLLPGGGFLYTSDVVFVVVTILLLALAGLAWFGSGMIIAPPIVWLGAAGLATLRTHTGLWTWAEWLVPVLLGVLLVGGLIGRVLSFRAARRRAVARNEYLGELAARPAPEPHREVAELDEEGLATQRFLLDRALQPLEEFEGFDWVEQFQTAAVRYQLNFCAYALALAQQGHAPSFRGYLSLAQRNLIEKMSDKRVWRFWRWENLWGNLDPNPDPIIKDDIMVSGYLGVMIGAYESNTGDGRFGEPGALTFRWSPRRAFEYDFGSIAAAVHDNMTAAALGMYPCEPNWVYSACNTFGMNTLLLHDRLRGTRYADDVLGRFAESMNEEFLTADGRVTAIRSSRLGLTIPSLTSTMADAGMALFLSPNLPAAARRTWTLVGKELVDVHDDGTVDLVLRGWDRLDVGNYRRSDVSPHAIIMAAAREWGDEDVYRAVQASADRKFEPVTTDGVRTYTKASTQANAMLALARFGRRGGFHDLVAVGPDDAIREGPVLAEAPYPDVLVARAVSDGAALDLVLRPGSARGRFPLVVANLRPHSRYAVSGATEASLVADESGRARLEVDLDDRRELRLAPQD